MREIKLAVTLANNPARFTWRLTILRRLAASLT
jgi:hypothetical protein